MHHTTQSPWNRRNCLRFLLSLGMGLFASSFLVAEEGQAVKIPFYVGTYTGGLSKGIYRSELDVTSGKLSEPKLVAELANPSFVHVHPSKKWLYAVSEVNRSKTEPNAKVVAYKIEADGSLTELNSQASGGDIPCYVSTDKTGKILMIANYGSGSISLYPLAENGQLEAASCFVQHSGKSVNKQRQEGPHAHSILVDPSNKFVLTADLGIDQVLVYQLDREGASVTPAKKPYLAQPPGSGPRHIAFAPSGKTVAINNELTSTVTLASWNGETGELKSLDLQSTLPSDYSGKNNTTAEVLFHPTAKAVYVSNRGHDSIAVFAWDEAKGKLKLIQHQPTLGKVPRNFCFDPTGKFLLAENQESDSIHVFQVNPSDGTLSPTESKITVGKPVCIRFVQ